jgi:hypothetical protein
MVDVLEHERRFRNLNPYCEPQLGKRNLYRSIGGEPIGTEINARLWVLNLSDGEHSLLDIAERSGLPFPVIHDAAELLLDVGLLEAVAEINSVTHPENPRASGSQIITPRIPEIPRSVAAEKSK